LLNILETVALYQAIRTSRSATGCRGSKSLAGKAAASYRTAKLIIKADQRRCRVVTTIP